MGFRDVGEVQRMKVERDVEGLVAVLCDDSKSRAERRCAAASLGDLRVKRALEPLVSVLDDDTVCAYAAQALGVIGDPVAAAPLAELYAAPPSRGVKKVAEKALDRLYERDPRGVRAVLEDWERRQAGAGRRGKRRK